MPKSIKANNFNYFVNEFPRNVEILDKVICISNDRYGESLYLENWEQVTSFTSNLITAANFTFGPIKNYDEEKLV